MKRQIDSTQRLVRKLFFKVDGTGTAAITSGGTDAVLVDNGTGSYKLTFNVAGRRLLAAVVQPVAAAGDLIATLDTTSDQTKAEVRLWDGTDGTTAKDGVFFLEVTLADSPDQT